MRDDELLERNRRWLELQGTLSFASRWATIAIGLYLLWGPLPGDWSRPNRFESGGLIATGVIFVWMGLCFWHFWSKPKR